MKKLFFPLVLLAALSTARTLLGQPLSPLEVVEAMKAPEVKTSFEQCVEGLPHPDMVKLVIVINEDGTTTLQSTLPEVDAAVGSCFTTVVGMVKLRAAGQKYKMVYSLSLPPAQAAVVQSAAPKPPATTPPAAAPGKPPDFTTSRPFDDQKWLSEVRKGTAFFVVGLILTVCGGAMVIVPMIYGMVTAAICGNDSTDSSDSICEGFNPYLLGVGLGGVAVLGTGIGLFVSGVVKRRHAEIIRKGLAWQGLTIGPDIVGRGAMMSSVWRF
jgi:hypothetical protein